MYSDPSLIRANPVRVNFNDTELNLINALVAYTGQQRAVLVRDLILEQARLILMGQADYAPGQAGNEAAQTSFFRASEGPHSV